jgi:hypothetical protein
MENSYSKSENTRKPRKITGTFSCFTKSTSKPVDLAKLYEFQPDFHFCADWDGNYFCEQQLMIEWFLNCFPENCKNIQQYQDLLGKIFHNEPLWDESLEEPPSLLCHTLSLARYRAIKKILKNELVTLEQLGISFEI